MEKEEREKEKDDERRDAWELTRAGYYNDRLNKGRQEMDGVIGRMEIKGAR